MLVHKLQVVHEVIDLGAVSFLPRLRAGLFLVEVLVFGLFWNQWPWCFFLGLLLALPGDDVGVERPTFPTHDEVLFRVARSSCAPVFVWTEEDTPSRSTGRLSSTNCFCLVLTQSTAQVALHTILDGVSLQSLLFS